MRATASLTTLQHLQRLAAMSVFCNILKACITIAEEELRKEKMLFDTGSTIIQPDMLYGF